MGYIFISYSHKDRDYVHRLQEALQNEGFEVWIDDRIDYGDEWLKVVTQNLDNSDGVIVVLSKNSYESDMVQNEVTRAWEKKKKIFPLLLEGENWLIVQAKQFVDVRDGTLPPKGFYKRLEAVTLRKKTKSDITEIAPMPEMSEHPSIEIPKPTSQRISALFLVAVIGTIAIVAALIAILPQFLKPVPSPTVTATTFLTQPPVPAFTPSHQIFDPHPAVGDYHDSKGITMRPVSAGKFTMGSNDGDPDERPAHIININSYYMDKYLVTNALYKTCVDAGVCTPPQNIKSYTHSNYYGNVQFDNYPVIYVDWNQAEAYCKWRGARLPTEAEWEKAARGPNEGTYPWGGSINCSYANYRGCLSDTTQVGNFENGKSAYNLYDMAGNVWEWMADWYSATYYGLLDVNVLNPLGPTNGKYRVLRGGSWNDDAAILRSTSRLKNDPTIFDFKTGFRCALSNP